MSNNEKPAIIDESEPYKLDENGDIYVQDIKLNNTQIYRILTQQFDKLNRINVVLNNISERDLTVQERVFMDYLMEEIKEVFM